jgi:hypothetical protein
MFPVLARLVRPEQIAPEPAEQEPGVPARVGLDLRQ